MIQNRQAPPTFQEGMAKIAAKARARGCTIWIDSEQQSFQASIDRWTIDLMRTHNRDGNILIYNTVQAYLKDSRHKLKYQLDLAKEEGWTLGLKLVRGAYMATEPRERIHDTKADTDESYNGIVRDLLTGWFEGYTPETLPPIKLFLAGHNSDTIRMALGLATELDRQGKLYVHPEFGQLMGMADDIGCETVQFGENLRQKYDSEGVSPVGRFIPRVYKCLQWGTIQETMLYLVRRAVENAAAVDRIKESATAAKKELWRRLTLRATSS
jgi:proline dehydrogenase